MAHASVASLSRTMDLILNYHHHSISLQFKNQIISLQKYTSYMQSYLEDPPDRANAPDRTKAPDRANNWEETIREVSNRAEDIIELLLSDSLFEGSSYSKIERGKYEIHYSFDEMGRVTEEIESITDRLKGGRGAETTGASNNELTVIISQLRGGSPALEIISIFGIGGTGKTTLARNAYNHPSVVEHFDIRAWSTVSQEYSLRGIVLPLMRCMNKSYAVSNSNSEDELVSNLRRNLAGKRFLIIMDDVWTQDALDKIKIVLPDHGNGSRIILTTRSFELVKSESHIHEKVLLDVATSWDLFREKIFQGDPCPSQLEQLGKTIARMCRGHPLSIQVFSGMLAADQTEAAWEGILENIKIAASQDGGGGGFSKILSLCYAYLPHYLRQCFLYLGYFRKDREIQVSKLVKLWAAEGFLNPNEYKSFEEMGEEHVEELFEKGLVSVNKRKSNGRIKSITVHDIIRDVCLSQSQTQIFVLQVDRLHSQVVAVELHSRRHVSNLVYGDNFLEGVYDSTTRTIMSFLDNGRLGISSIGNVRLLRILDLSDAYNCDLPKEVFGLFHLRYLAFCCGFSISEAISNLENLQTLIICPREHSTSLDKLPEGIWRMPQLRHLEMFLFQLPTHKGEMWSPLENLQTLSKVEDFVCSRESLEMIPNLKRLAIRYTVYRDLVHYYQLHNLKSLQKLEILKIEMEWFFGEQPRMGCVFPPTLTKLSLSGVRLSWKEDMEVVGSLPHLQVLKLRKHACTGRTWRTSEGRFPQLTYLMIKESSLDDWITKTSHFPRLKCLVLRDCKHLWEVPHGIGKIKTLELIEVDRGNKTLLQSAKLIQQDRQWLGAEYSLQIRAV